MPGLLDLINDPLFQQLPEDRQYALRKDYFQNQVATDPLFQKLTPDRQNAIGRDVLFDVKPKPISQAQFEKSRGLTPGSSGGITAVPFLQDPVTMLAMGGIGAPFGAGPSALYGGRAAGLGEHMLRGAGTFGSFGAVQGAEEGGVGGAIKGGLKEGLVGAAFGPALAPAKTVLGAIGKPIAIGAPVGFATAEPGHRLEGAALGAASFLGLKGATRGIGYGAEKLGEAIGPVKKLFARGAQKIVDRYGVTDAPIGVVDAPAGLTEEVFRPKVGLHEQIELTAGPRLFSSDINFSGPARESANVFERAFYARQSPRERELLRRRLTVEQSRTERLSAKSETLPPEPPVDLVRPTVEPFPSDIGFGPARESADIFERALQGRQTFKERTLLSRRLNAEQSRADRLQQELIQRDLPVIESMRETFTEGVIPDAKQLEMLNSIAKEPAWSNNARGQAQQILDRIVPASKLIVPPPPPVEAAPKPIAPTKAKSGAVPDVERELQNYIRTYLKGINPGKLQEEFRTATGKQGFRFLSQKGMAADEAALDLFEKGYLSEPTVDALRDAVARSARGEKVFSMQGGQRAVSAKQAAKIAESETSDMVIAGVEQEGNIGNLITLMNQHRPDDPIFKAAERRLTILRPDAQIGAGSIPIEQINDGPLKDVLGNFGPGPYSKEQLERAQTLANQIQQKGLLNTDVQPVTPQKTAVPKVEVPPAPDIAMTKTATPITFQQTEAGQQGVIPGAEGRTVPSGPLRPKAPQTEKPLDLEMPGIAAKEPGLFGEPLPRTPNAQAFFEGPADQALLHGATEGDLNDLAAKAIQLGKIQHAEIVSKEFADRMTGARPINPNPLDDLGKAERENSLSKLLNILKDDKGMVSIGQDPKETSLSKDMNGFFDRWQNVFQSWKNIELRRGVDAFVRRGISVQELARTHPEIDPIYQPFHTYPREAVNRHVESITPLFKQEGRTPYFDLPVSEREAVDKLAILQNLNRQDLPRFTAEELVKRGFNEDQVGAFNDMLDYGQAILRDRRKWYVESQLPAMVEAGTPEIVARATLEARAEQALKGMEHWVPHYRAGTKTVVVRDRNGTVASYNMVNSVRDRVDTVARLKQEFPPSRGYKIEEGVLENFVRAKAFDEIDIANLEILSRFAKVDPVIADEFLTQLRPALLGRSEAMSQFKHFENIPGFKQDLREGLIKSGNSAYTYIERQRAYRAATDALANINAKEKPELFKFADRYIKDNMLPGEKVIGEIQDALYSYVLGGNIKQYAVQLTQMPITVIPRMMKFGSMGEVGDALGTASRWSFARDLTKAPAELQTAWREAYKKGVFQPRAEMFVGDALERLPWAEAQVEEGMAKQLMQFQHPAAHAMRKARDWWMLPMTDADMRTRLGAFTGFYKLGRDVQGMNPAQATEFAITEANRTNYLYGRAESPELFGRHGIPRFVNMLKQWPAQYMSFLGGVLRDARREALSELASQGITQASRPELYKQIAKTTDFRTFATSIAAMTALGGVYYNIPGFAKSALSSLYGIDPETAARDLLTNKVGLPDIATDVVLRGVGSLAGVDVSRSMALGDMFGVQGVTDLLGPGPAVVENVAKGTWDLVKSQTQPFGPSAVDALERMSPNGFKNLIKGAALAAEGIRTRQGGQLAGTETMRTIDPVLQGLGFTPLAVANAKALQRAGETRDRFHRSQQSNMLENLAEAIVKNKQEDVTAVYGSIQKINEDAMAKGRPELLITIDNGQLRQRIAEMLTPAAKIKRVPKNARAAQQELERLYLGAPAPPP